MFGLETSLNVNLDLDMHELIKVKMYPNAPTLTFLTAAVFGGCVPGEGLHICRAL